VAYKSKTMSIMDRKSGRVFLVDSGADESVYPATEHDKRAHARTGLTSPPLVAADGNKILTFGRRTIQLELANGRSYTQSFWLAGVTRPILGADFFIVNHIAIDLANRRLTDLGNGSHIYAGDALPATERGIHHVATTRYEKILAEFPDLLVPHFRGKVTHNTEHFIVTSGPPIHGRARRLDPERLKVARDEFDKMLELGIIRRSDSPWASPLVVAPKPGGGWRPCGDYRRLNEVTEDDRYPLPHIHDFNGNLKGKKVFSVVDLTRGFHHIPVNASDVPKTAVITPFGLFEFLRTPFGLKNAAQAFQRLMDGILRGLGCIFVYLDDILIASDTAEQHEHDLRELFATLAANDITVNRKKCQLGLSEVTYLGHRVTMAGISPLPDRITAIKSIVEPTTKVALQRFLGTLNYYRRFMPGFANKLAPLHGAVGDAGKAKAITWSKECQVSFEAAKDALADFVLLHHPDPSAPTALTTDASDVALGAELSQRTKDGTWVPLAFFSKKMNPAQKNYSALGRELLAMYEAVKHFRHFVEGKPFTIWTDHKPLTFTMKSNADRNPRESRHLSYIAEFTTDIRHVKGVDNVVADTLSRDVRAEPDIVDGCEVSSVSKGIDFSAMAEAQRVSDEIAAYRTAVTGLNLQDVDMGNGVTLLCDTTLANPRPIVPSEWTRPVFDSIHQLSHAGHKPTLRAVSSRFVWHNLRKDVKNWCKTCHPCQASKVGRHVKAPLAERAPPSDRFRTLHVDIVGPLASSEGIKHLLTVVDRFTRWPEAIPIDAIDAETCARALVRSWVARFGVPDDMTSDRGSQFVSSLWSNMCKILGTKARRTTAYHPQANGMVERMHRTLKGALKAKCVGPNWMDELPLVLLGIRTAVKDGPDCSPADLVYGSDLVIPGEFSAPAPPIRTSSDFLVALQEVIRNRKPPPAAFKGPPQRSYVPADLLTAKSVYIRIDRVKKPLERPYEGPFEVVERFPKYFVVMKNGKKYTVSIDRLKVHYQDQQPQGQKPLLPALRQKAAPPRPAGPSPSSTRPRLRRDAPKLRLLYPPLREQEDVQEDDALDWEEDAWHLPVQPCRVSLPLEALPLPLQWPQLPMQQEFATQPTDVFATPPASCSAPRKKQKPITPRRPPDAPGPSQELFPPLPSPQRTPPAGSSTPSSPEVTPPQGWKAKTFAPDRSAPPPTPKPRKTQQRRPSTRLTPPRPPKPSPPRPAAPLPPSPAFIRSGRTLKMPIRFKDYYMPESAKKEKK
jgi:transposase InsO family protein